MHLDTQYASVLVLAASRPPPPNHQTFYFLQSWKLNMEFPLLFPSPCQQKNKGSISFSPWNSAPLHGKCEEKEDKTRFEHILNGFWAICIRKISRITILLPTVLEFKLFNFQMVKKWKPAVSGRKGLWKPNILAISRPQEVSRITILLTTALEIHHLFLFQ